MLISSFEDLLQSNDYDLSFGFARFATHCSML